ncbi:MAG TPA: formate dehydrogenase accessory sulfurtransferase FdhD [Smithellaceae bacterium]|nr:formate dehydrogenase accessory sulfurtransferase FdhD [Smithellaceae bacterium]
MDERVFSTFNIKEIASDNGTIRLRDCEKDVIGEISLKIYINGTEYASLLCLNQLTEELALGFLFSEGVIDTIGDVASISYNERMFAVMINLVEGKTVERCESLRSVTSGCGKCFTYINPLKHDKFPTAAAVNLAREYHVTLLGYVRKNSGFVYAGETRFIEGGY